jgi:transposase
MRPGNAAWCRSTTGDRYRDEGYLAIDNNLAEQALRGVALGRNNWGVFGSEAGGRTAATLYSVDGT